MNTSRRLFHLVSTVVAATILANAAWAGPNRRPFCRIPLTGSTPLATGSDKVRIVNPDEVRRGLDDDGLVVGGGGKDGVQAVIEFDDWDVNSGTLSLWLTPVNWSDKISFYFGSQSEGKGHFKCDLGRHGLRGFGYGVSALKTWPRVGTAKADWLTTLKPGDWRHLALVWKKGEFIRAYLDGEEFPWRNTAFPWPEALKRMWFSGNSRNDDRTRIKDLRFYARPLMAAEIAALSGKTARLVENFDVNIAPFGPVSTPPKMDGIISKGEYPTSIPGLLDVKKHALYPEFAEVHTGFDEDFLYLAATVHPPVGRQSVVRARDDEGILSGDSFHLLLRSDSDPKNQTFNAAYVRVGLDGASYDASETANWTNGEIKRDPTADFQVKSASRLTDGLWTVELKIPLKDLGLSADQPFLFSLGFLLGGNPDVRLSFQIHPQSFDHPQAFSLGRFVPLRADIQLGEVSQGLLDQRFSLKNVKSEAIDGEVACLIARPEISGSAEDWDYDKRMGEKISVKVKGGIHEWSETFSLSTGATTELADSFRLNDPGQYVLVAKGAFNGEEFYRRALPFVYFSPIDVELRPVPSKKMIKAKTSLYGVDLDDVAEIDFRLPTKDGTVKDARFPVQNRRKTYEVDMADMPAGKNEIEVRLIDGRGQAVASRSLPFEKLEPEWLRNRVALEALSPDWVPEPWTSVAVDADVVGVWGRTFQFSDDSIIPKMTSQGKTLNANPAVIKAVTADGDDEMKVKTTKVERLGKGRVVVTQTGESPLFKFEARHVIEFDGLDVVTVTLTPKGSVNVDSLRLDVPLDVAMYYNSHRYNLGVLDGEVEFGKINYLWIGDDEVGLDLVFENYKGWLVDSTRPRLALNGKDGHATLSLSLANRPVIVARPMTFTFSLQPTPIRPLPDEFRDWRISTMFWEGLTTHWIALFSRWSSALTTPVPRSDDVLRDMVDHARGHGHKNYPYMAPSCVSLNDVINHDAPFFVNYPDLPDKFEKTLVIKNANDAPKIDEAWYFAEDWQIHPQIMGGVAPNAMYKCSMTSSFPDYFVYNVDKMARRGLDGVYFDLASASENFDAEKGLSYQTLDGKTEGTREVFATRDLYKRLVRVFANHRGRKGFPYILGHGFPSGMAYQGFYSVLFHGEGMKPADRFDMTRWYLQTNLKSSKGNQGSRMFSVDPDANRDWSAVGYRLSYPQRQIGIPMLVLPQYAKGTRDRETNKKRYHDPALAREMLSFVVPHDNIIWPTWIDKGTVIDFWKKALIPFGMKNVEFHGYWEDDVKTDADHVKASYWKKSDAEDYLVAVANWSDEETEVNVTLPKRILALGSGLDMENGEETKAVDQSGSFQLTVPAHDLRMLRFSKNN